MHRLNINPDMKPIKQQQRRFNPEIMEVIQSEVNPITKKNGMIWVCIDFHDLNEACPKDEFPLPIMVS